MYTIYIMERKIIILGLVIILILTLLCTKMNINNQDFPINIVDPYWKNRRFMKKTVDNQLLTSAPFSILEKFESNQNEKKRNVGKSINDFLTNSQPRINNTENTDADLNKKSTLSLFENNKIKMNDLKTINHDVKKINKHATTRPKLNAKFQNQGPLLPERKGFEYQLMKEGKCKFFSGDKCPSAYPLSTGANIAISGVNGVNLSCNGVSNIEKAEAIATINEYGKIDKVHIVKKGKGYITKPNINIIGGGGYGGKCDTVIDDKGSIQYIDILSGGEGYTSSPKIEMENPNGSNNCMLCCQPDLFN
jgi:hypothetical protein